MPWRAMKRLAKSPEDSSWAASWVGPKIFRPRARKVLTIPAAKGRLGADHGEVDFSPFGEIGQGDRIGDGDVLSSCSRAVPALPGATKPSAGREPGPGARPWRTRDRRNR